MDKNGPKFDKIDEATLALKVKALSKRPCPAVVLQCAGDELRCAVSCLIAVCLSAQAPLWVCYQNYAMLPLDCDTTLAQPRDTQGSSSQTVICGHYERFCLYLNGVGGYNIFRDMIYALCRICWLIRFSVWRSNSIPALSSTGEDGTAWQQALKQFVPLAGSIMPILGGIIQSMVIIQHRGFSR